MYKFLFFFCMCFSNLYSSHLMGGSLNYTHLGSSNYNFKYTFYRDCSGQTAPDTVFMSIKSNNCGVDTTIMLFKTSGGEIQTTCLTELTECSGGSHFGTEEYVYENNFILQMCSDWVFSVSLNARNGRITTIISPDLNNMYLESTLNNVIVSNNSSPKFVNKPVYFLCLNNTMNQLSLQAIDDDGDSLFYKPIIPLIGKDSTITYTSGFSLFSPLQGIFSYDSINGNLNFNPFSLQIGNIAVRVEEYRNGVLIGSIIREVQIVVNNCVTYSPTLSGPYNFNVYPNHNLNFDIISTSLTNILTISSNCNQVIPNATFNIGLGNNPTSNFNWTPSISDIRSIPYAFTVNVVDDACLYSSNKTYIYRVKVIDINAAFTVNGNDLIASPSGFNYQWRMNGNIIPGANSQIYTITQGASYSVIVGDSLFADTSASQNVYLLGVENSNFSEIKIYPNPTSGKTIIEGQNLKKIEIFDAFGKLVFEKEINDQKTILDLKLPIGLFYSKVTCNNNSYKLIKLIIE